MPRAPKVYVASPLGFTEPTRYYYEEQLLPRLRAAGIEPLDPWTHGDRSVAELLEEAQQNKTVEDAREALVQLDYELGQRNAELIADADGLLAVLDGTDIDSGTAAEIGFAAAKGKPIVGLRTDLREAGENDGCTVNVQVEYFIRASGGTILADLDASIEALRRIVDASSGGRDGEL